MGAALWGASHDRWIPCVSSGGGALPLPEDEYTNSELGPTVSRDEPDCPYSRSRVVAAAGGPTAEGRMGWGGGSTSNWGMGKVTWWFANPLIQWLSFVPSHIPGPSNSWNFLVFWGTCAQFCQNPLQFYGCAFICLGSQLLLLPLFFLFFKITILRYNWYLTIHMFKGCNLTKFDTGIHT